MKTKDAITIIAVILAVLGGAGILSLLNSGGDEGWIFGIILPSTLPSPVQTTIGTITINTTLPQGSATVPLYHGYYGPNDKIDYSSPNSGKIQKSIPEVSDIPQLAEQALAPYGGIPPDAVCDGIFKSTSRAETATGEVVAIYLDSTNIGYSRLLNNMPVFGSGGQMIYLEFGENGELLHLYKKWRTLNKIADVPIITSKQAADKFLRGEILNAYQEPVDVMITNISLGYYDGYPDRAEETLEPIWIFSGPTFHGDMLSFFVDARISGSSLKFGNFTASPTTGAAAPLTVQFRDTSTGPVWHWRWDFGDGTVDWTQNPVHVYRNKGIYTVKLLVSDDERENLVEKTNYILIGKKAIVMHIDAKLEDFIATLNAMDIQQGTKNSLTQKLENAKAKNDDALKFIDQNKEDQANNMLNAEENLLQAFTSEVDAQAGNGVSTKDAARLNSRITEIQELIQQAIRTPI